MPQGDDCKSPGFGHADLMLICGLDRVTAERMLQLGLSGFAEMAAWTATDVAHWRDCLGLERRISAGCWVEQAAILARGGETSFARRVRRGEIAALVRHPAPPSLGLLRSLPPLSPQIAGFSARLPTAAFPATSKPPRGSLMRRLGTSPSTSDTPRGLPASFTGVVEEAVVEIVRRSPSVRDTAEH